MIDRIRDLYSRATIFSLVRRCHDAWDNVYTAVIYGSDLTAEATFGVLSPRVEQESFEAHRVVVDSTSAARFAEQARTQRLATIPGTERHVRYSPDICFDAFLPRGSYPDSETESCSSTYSCWRCRATSTIPTLGKTVLDDRTYTNVALSLPTFADVDYAYLNVASDLTRLQAIDEVLPVPLTLEVSGGDILSFAVDGHEAWIERFSPLSMSIDTYDFGLLVGTHNAPVTTHTGTIPVAPSSACNATLIGAIARSSTVAAAFSYDASESALESLSRRLVFKSGRRLCTFLSRREAGSKPSPVI